MSLVAVVPMKGHSERVPGKNLRPMAGRPLFHWVIEKLLTAEMVDQVLVETDSDEIEIAVRQAFGSVRVLRRPDRLHGDMVPMHDVVANIAEQVEHTHVLQTHSTNPLLTAETTDRAIRSYLDSGDHDSLMSVTPWRSRFFYRDGRPVNHDPAKLSRTQDLPPILEENSNLYIAPRELIIETGMRVGLRPLLFEMDPREAIDIDDEADFEMAEALIENRND